MGNSHDILRELDEYAKKRGVEVSTVCRNATGNPRLRDRLENRIGQIEKNISALREYMSKHPVDAPSEGAS